MTGGLENGDPVISTGSMLAVLKKTRRFPELTVIGYVSPAVVESPWHKFEGFDRSKTSPCQCKTSTDAWNILRILCCSSLKV